MMAGRLYTACGGGGALTRSRAGTKFFTEDERSLCAESKGIPGI